MARVVALLDTMWDWRAMTSGAGYQSAPQFFRINPENKSGKMLYRLVGSDNQLLVTNACRELVSSSDQRGTPDPAWVAANLADLERMEAMDLLLVCGTVAQGAFRRSGYRPRCPVLETLHPAARTWSRGMIADTAAIIGRMLAEPVRG